MLKSTRRTISATSKGRFAIVCSRYNSEFTDAMLAAAVEVFQKAGIREIETFRVPGAYEIPVIAATLAGRKSRRPDAIVCLGLIIQGETNHADHIGEAVTFALTDIAIKHGVPCIHEVLTVKTTEQARKRCVDPETNRGAEAAHTAIDTVATLAAAKGAARPKAR